MCGSAEAERSKKNLIGGLCFVRVYVFALFFVVCRGTFSRPNP